MTHTDAISTLLIYILPYARLCHFNSHRTFAAVPSLPKKDTSYSASLCPSGSSHISHNPAILVIPAQSVILHYLPLPPAIYQSLWECNHFVTMLY